MMGLTMAQVLGQPAVDVFSQWPSLTEKYGDILDALEEISIGEGEAQRWFELSLSPLRNKDKTVVGR